MNRWRAVAGTTVVIGVFAVTAPPASAAAAPPAAAADAGPWLPPLTGPLIVTRSFDPPRTTYGPGHRGVDLAGAAGAVVRAAGGGRVAFAALLAGRGVVVVVHGELRTTYEPVSATVAVGATVATGEPIGTLAGRHRGQPSCTPGACLHWGLRRGTDYLDPLRLLRRAPSVLLPVPASHRATTLRFAQVAPPVTAGRVMSATEPTARATAPATAPDPGWSLRASEAPLGAVAALALLAGLGLIVRPRRPPDSPVSPPGTAGPATSLAAVAAPTPASAPPADLTTERLRRRSA